jgi:hypothetical protein
MRLAGLYANDLLHVKLAADPSKLSSIGTINSEDMETLFAIQPES